MKLCLTFFCCFYFTLFDLWIQHGSEKIELTANVKPSSDISFGELLELASVNKNYYKCYDNNIT